MGIIIHYDPCKKQMLVSDQQLRSIMILDLISYYKMLYNVHYEYSSV